MKRIVLFFAALLTSIAAFAYSPEIRNVDIKVLLHKDGSADFTEVWDVTVASGTEWYLVRNYLDDIKISNLTVSDETGRDFITESGNWDVDRNINEKAGRCGLHRTDEGYEICWGVGSFGPHVFTVSYSMSNCVKSLNDYDMLYMQLLSPGLSSTPQNVDVTISTDCGTLNLENTYFWGFGYEGTSEMDEDGTIYLNSSGRVKSVIVLLRFDKGIFSPVSVQNRDFQEAYDIAMDGADFGGDKTSRFADFLAKILPIILVIFVAWKAAGNKKRILGVRPKDVQWSREVPFNGDLEASNYVLSRLGENKKLNTYASAVILRMVYDGSIIVNRKDEKKVDLMFNDSKAENLTGTARKLYNMMKEAAGSDQILQDKEFSRWSRRNYKRVNDWIDDVTADGISSLSGHKYINGYKFTPEGQAQARGLLGFKKFISDFTLMNERGSRDVGLWQDYLVFASLYGIADKVAKELKDIDPQFFEKANSFDYDTMSYIISRNAVLSSAITNAQVKATSGSAGHGGTSSFGGGGFGGGGGFSGGGFGGGSR